MGALERHWVFLLMERFITTVSSGANFAETASGTPCAGAESFFGCGGTITGVLASFVLGTIGGAPLLLNAVLLLAVNGLIILAWLKYGRGVND